MTQFRLVHLTSVAELRERAAPWDDLWLRSDVSVPMMRAELVAQWAEQFARGGDFHALAVEEDGTWVAALPLVGTKVLRMIRAGAMPVNSWVPGGGLLVEPQCDLDRALDMLVAQVSRASWDLLWLDEAPVDAIAWNALRAAFVRAGMATSVIDRYDVAWLDVEHDWDAFSRRLSRTFRRHLARAGRRLEEAGEIQFEACRDFSWDRVEQWLRRGFDVEHRGWKGKAGTSVLSRGMLPFFLRQAQQLAQWRQLHMAFLSSNRHSIAFAYGAFAKGVYHCCKIGYDEAYARYSPGNLLYQNMFRQFWHDPQCRAVDFAGEMTEAQQHWRPAVYRLGRMVVASRHWLSRAMVHAHQYWWPHLRRMRRYLAGRTAPSQAENRPMVPVPRTKVV